MKKLFLVALMVCLAAAARCDENDPATNLLQTLRPGHPRLLVLDDHLAAVREMIKTDPMAGLIHQQLQAEAEKLLSEPPLTYKSAGSNTRFWM